MVMRCSIRVLGLAVVLGIVVLTPDTIVAETPKTEPQASAAQLLEKAAELIHSERLGEALSVLKSVDADVPSEIAKVDTLLGELYLHLDKPGKAREFFEHATLTTLEDSTAILGLAKANLALGDLRRARRHARAALRADPDLTDAHLVLAEVADRSGFQSDAEDRFSKLRRDRPGSEDVVVAYARFLSRRGDAANALYILDTFVAQNPTAAEAADLLGRLFWERGERGRALRYRALAAKVFIERGNVYRGGAIRTWLAANFPRQTAPKDNNRKPPSDDKAVTPDESARPPVAAQSPRPPVPVLKRPDPLPFEPNVTLSTGSGFIVERGRYVVTNRHVIENTEKVAVRSGTGEVRLARIAGVSQNDDLAILELARPFPENYAIPFAQTTSPRPGKPALVMGYPLAGLLGWQQPSLTEGIVSKASGIQDDPNTFLITTKMNKGNSGGPIFDRDGRLIGVVVAKLDTIKVYETKGHLPEDINVGIKVGRLLDFLRVTVAAGDRTNESLTDLEDLYQIMLSRVVLVAGQVR